MNNRLVLSNTFFLAQIPVHPNVISAKHLGEKTGYTPAGLRRAMLRLLDLGLIGEKTIGRNKVYWRFA